VINQAELALSIIEARKLHPEFSPKGCGFSPETPPFGVILKR
jgi:hypothetical protein